MFLMLIVVLLIVGLGGVPVGPWSAYGNTDQGTHKVDQPPIGRRWITGMLGLSLGFWGSLWGLTLWDRGYRMIGAVITACCSGCLVGSLLLYWLTVFPWSWSWRW